jgi:phosphoglycerate dehydrogenase-like enzyme
MSKLKAIYILNTDAYDVIYGADERADMSALLDIYAPQQTVQSILEHPEVLKQAEVILSGWGAPCMDAQFLNAAPNLKLVLYGAGSIRGIVTDEFWDRGILINSAWGANAIPVAHYTLSQILFCLKHGWQFAHAVKRLQAYPKQQDLIGPGAYRSTVGIISLGMIGRLMCQLLTSFQLRIVAYDPFASPELAKTLGVELVSLDEVFQQADVVSLHTPWLKETEGMIKGKHFAMMKNGASFINTARGAVVNEPEMIEVLTQRPDLFAVLDVTHPEPPEPGSVLYTLENVIVTPHIAGAMGRECNRMGRYMVEDLQRYLRGEPLQWGITREMAKVLA